MWKLLAIILVNLTMTSATENEYLQKIDTLDTLVNLTGTSAIKNVYLPKIDILHILRAQPSPKISETCKEHLLEYLNGVLTRKQWASQMMDSVTKYPDGILMGRYSFPGHFDECVNAGNENFTGKHCMTVYNPNLDPNSKTMKLLNSLEEIGWNLKPSQGMCFPSTCNASEIENVMKSAAGNGAANFFQITVLEENCWTKEFRPFRTEDWITVAVLAVIVCLAIGSTAYDLFQRFKLKNDKPSILWSSFSLYTNGKLLFRISQSSAQLKSLHGIRFLSMSWVILAHAYFAYTMAHPVNPMTLINYKRKNSFVPISNGFVSVDTFFFLSGLLVVIIFFRDIAKTGYFDVPVAFIHRYIRLTPPLALLMLIHGTIISRMGNGPFWNWTIKVVENSCRESWLAGLLYVQNYVEPKPPCLEQAWYLSADMQMYWVSPLILYPLLWFPSLAPYFLILVVLAAALTNFAIAFVNKLKPSILFGININPTYQYLKEYVPFYTRMAPWFIGVAAGYIICGIKAKKIRLNLSKFWVLIGWASAFALLGGSLFGIIRFMSREYSPAEASLYLAFHRVGWALGLAWVVVACVGGYGGVINSILSLDFFQPLAKLSYCTFLIHMTLQKYRLGTSRINLYVRHFDVVYGFFGDLLLSNLISIPITLLFEIPFSSLDRFFLQKLVIFPLPKPRATAEKENINEKAKKPAEPNKAVEEGKVNPLYWVSDEMKKS